MFAVCLYTTVVIVCGGAVVIHCAVYHPEVREDTMGVYTLSNEEQCRRLCWYRRLCSSYSYTELNTRTTLHNCVLHSNATDAIPDPQLATPPPDWREKTVTGDRITHRCASRPCGETQVCLPTATPPPHYFCVDQPATCENTKPISNGSVVTSGVRQNDVANVTCDARYVPRPRQVSTQLKCQVTGRWTDFKGACGQAEFIDPAGNSVLAPLPWTVIPGWRACVRGKFIGSNATRSVTIDLKPGDAKYIALHFSIGHTSGADVIWDFYYGSWAGLKRLGNMSLLAGDSFAADYHVESADWLNVTLQTPRKIVQYVIPFGHVNLSQPTAVATMQVFGNVVVSYINLVSGCGTSVKR